MRQDDLPHARKICRIIDTPTSVLRDPGGGDSELDPDRAASG